jgi:anti-sigma B factor antagonist
MKFETEIRQIGKHRLLKTMGEIELQNVEEVSEALWQAIMESDLSLIIDLTDIKYVDSSGIGVLVTAHKRMKEKKGNFALLGVPEDLMKVLRLSDLDRYFTIYQSESEIPD